MALKRGAVFTLMAIVISSIILVSFESASNVAIQSDQPELLRVRVVDGVSDSFFSYAEASLRVSTFQALNNLSIFLGGLHDPELNRYFADREELRKNLARCIFDNETNLEVNGADILSSAPCMNSTFFPALLSNYSTLVNDSMNVDIDFAWEENSFNYSQNLPFEIRVNVTFHVNVTDDFATWEMPNQELAVNVPLGGMINPVTYKASQTRMYTKDNLTATIVTINDLLFSEINDTVFDDMIRNGEYRKALNRSPSLMQRYYGAFDAVSEFAGVEVFIDGRDLNDSITSPWGFDSGNPMLGERNYSFTDYELFRSINPGGFSPREYETCDTPRGVNAISFSTGGDTKRNFWLNVSVLQIYSLFGENRTGCT